MQLFCSMMLGCWLGWVSTVAAESPKYEGMVDDLLAGASFGQTPEQVLERLKDRVRAKYRPELERASGFVELDAIHQRARDTFRRIRDSYVEFQGRTTGWDISPVGTEFRHGTQESMLFVDGANYRDYYFFIRRQLWKCFRVYNDSAFSGGRFETVLEAFEGQLGRAVVRKVARAEGALEQPTAKWSGERSVMEVVDAGSHMVMVVTDTRMVARLPQLRKNALVRKDAHMPILDKVVMSDDELEAWRETQRTAAYKPHPAVRRNAR